MREEHKELIARVDSLRTAADGIEAAVTAGAILALFESHLWKENELLVPAFVADPNVSLSDLLIGMHELRRLSHHRPSHRSASAAAGPGCGAPARWPARSAGGAATTRLG